MSLIEKNLTVEGRREGSRKGSVGHCLHLARAIRGRQFGVLYIFTMRCLTRKIKQIYIKEKEVKNNETNE